MTGRTHDLAAFTALTFIIAYYPLWHMSLGTVFISFSSNMIGGLTPDIDQPTGDLWHKLPAGGLYSRLFTPLLGGHRYISHSVSGVLLFGFLSKITLNYMSRIVLVDMNIVWWCFMIGFLSHLFMDLFTKEGIPLLFPIPIKFGIPPISFLRIRTGGSLEKFFVFPGLIAINAFLIYTNYHKFLDFVRHFIR